MSWTGWRRRPEAGACDWCLMLAGRGAVYRTEATALGHTKFHDWCRCEAEMESQPDARLDVLIDPDDADRILNVRHSRTGLHYRYAFQLGELRAVPAVPRPKGVQRKARQVLKEWSGTPERAENIRLQITQISGRLAAAPTAAARAWMIGRLDELRRELAAGTTTTRARRAGQKKPPRRRNQK